MGSPKGILWLAIALNLLGQFGVFSGDISSTSAWGLLSFTGLAVMVGASSLLAWAGARFFQHTTHQQDLELLVTTPMGSRDILAGQWRVLRHGLKFPLMVTLALALPAGAALVYDFLHSYREEFYFLLPPFLVAVNLAAEALALCWVGMRFGLIAPTLANAVLRTVALVQVLPLVLAAGIMTILAFLAAQSMSRFDAPGRMPTVVPVLLFLLGKNVSLSVWARMKLRRELRLRF
jgi:hypothetical protein